MNSRHTQIAAAPRPPLGGPRETYVRGRSLPGTCRQESGPAVVRSLCASRPVALSPDPFLAKNPSWPFQFLAVPALAAPASAALRLFPRGAVDRWGSLLVRLD